MSGLPPTDGHVREGMGSEPRSSIVPVEGMSSSPPSAPPPSLPSPPSTINDTSPPSKALSASLNAQQSTLLTGELPDAAFLTDQYLARGFYSGCALGCGMSSSTSSSAVSTGTNASTNTNTSTNTEVTLSPETNTTPTPTPNPSWFWPPRATRTLWRLYTSTPPLPSGIPNYPSIAATLTALYTPTFNRGSYTPHDIQTALLPSPPLPHPPTPGFSPEELRLARELWIQFSLGTSEEVFVSIARRMSAAFGGLFGRGEGFSAEECAWVVQQAEWEEREYFSQWSMCERKRVWVRWITCVPVEIRSQKWSWWQQQQQQQQRSREVEEYRKVWYEYVAGRLERDLWGVCGRRYTARQVEWCVNDWEAEVGVRDLVEPGWRAEGLVRVFGEEAVLVDGFMMGV
ncbi:MAG: hypothetical protein M1824_004595 [Vezdaea acicularis]|nr:MAG: hypothetical protein M1824_004595 [Vezdaea acicularis]